MSQRIHITLIATLTLLLAHVSVTAQNREKISDSDFKKITQAAKSVVAQAKPKAARNILIFTRPAGFVHSSIDESALAMKLIGQNSGAFSSTVTTDLAAFKPASLKQYDAIIMANTTGDWITPTADDMKKFAAKGATVESVRKELIASITNFVNNGGGFIGLHSAADANRVWPEFKTMLGGLFNQHPWRNYDTVTVQCEAKNHPVMKAFDGKDFDITDEIYQFGPEYSRDNLRVLMRLDTAKTDMNKGDAIRRTDGDFAVAWVRRQGKGRVFYCSLGHNEHIFYNKTILQHYLDGIQFAMGDLKANAAPSGSKSAPKTAFHASESLFNGANLDGWDYKPGGWEVRSKQMTVNEDGGYIWTQQNYSNFILDLDFRMAKGCNSGVFFRTDPSNPVQGGFEIQIIDAKNWAKGKLTDTHISGALYDAQAPTVDAANPAGEWNHMRLSVIDSRVQVTLNGQKVNDADLNKWTTGNKNPDGSKNKFKTALKDLPRTGKIGLQYHGHPVWFRNINITNLIE